MWHGKSKARTKEEGTTPQLFMNYQTLEEAARLKNSQLQSLNLKTQNRMRAKGSKSSTEMVLLSISKAKPSKHSFKASSVCGGKNNLPMLLQHERKEQHLVPSQAQGQ